MCRAIFPLQRCFIEPRIYSQYFTFQVSNMSIFSCHPLGPNFQGSKWESPETQAMPITDEWLDTLWQPCQCPYPNLCEAIKPRRWEFDSLLDPPYELSLWHVRGDLLWGSQVKVLKTRRIKIMAPTLLPHPPSNLMPIWRSSWYRGQQMTNIFSDEFWFHSLFRVYIISANQIKPIWQLIRGMK